MQGINKERFGGFNDENNKTLFNISSADTLENAAKNKSIGLKLWVNEESTGSTEQLNQFYNLLEDNKSTNSNVYIQYTLINKQLDTKKSYLSENVTFELNNENINKVIEIFTTSSVRFILKGELNVSSN